MSTFDFDLHGIVGIRLLNAAAADAAVVEKQMGSMRATLSREPDLVIRCVDRISLSSPLRLLSDGDTAFNDDAFFILRGRHKTSLRAQVPFEAIGGRCEIVCEGGVAGLPLLVAIINLTMLAKGVVPIHASAFMYRGRGVLAAGWSKGGKTEALLSFLARGAQYVADDWVYVDVSGKHLYGIPEPVRLRGWHLADLPQYRRCIGLMARARLQLLGLADRWKDDVSRQNRLIPSRSLGRVLHFLARQAFITVAPQQIFAGQFAQQPVPFDHLFLLCNHESHEIVVEPIDANEVARRMVFSVQEERDRFLSYYRQFRFAFPDRANSLIDESERLQRELLLRVLSTKPAHVVLHPYPVRIPRLFESMQSLVCPTTAAPAEALAEPAKSAKSAAGGPIRIGPPTTSWS